MLWYILIRFTYFFVFDQTLHQATSFDKLAQLFNAESHAIGIKPVHGIDGAIAKYVFEKFVRKMDMYMSLKILTQNDSYNFHAIILIC